MLSRQDYITIFEHTGYWKGAAAFAVSFTLGRRPQLVTRFLPAFPGTAAFSLTDHWYYRFLTSPPMSVLLGVGVATNNFDEKGFNKDAVELPLYRGSVLAENGCECFLGLRRESLMNGLPTFYTISEDGDHRIDPAFAQSCGPFGGPFMRNCLIRDKAKRVMTKEPSTDWNDAVNSERLKMAQADEAGSSLSLIETLWARAYWAKNSLFRTYW